MKYNYRVFHKGKQTLQCPWFKKNLQVTHFLWSFHIARLMEKYHGMPACWTKLLRRPLNQPKTHLQMPQIFLLCLVYVTCTVNPSFTLEISWSCSWLTESIKMLSSVSETGKQIKLHWTRRTKQSRKLKQMLE